MIVEMYKYLFIGPKEELDRFFSKAQEKGAAEFVSQVKKKMVEIPLHVEHIVSAIKTLRKQPYIGEFYITEELDAHIIANQILELKQAIENFSEEKRYIQSEIARISPFGDFSLEDIRDIEMHAKKHVQFFCMKEFHVNKGALPEDLIYIGTEYDMNYFISVSRTLVSGPGLIEMHFEKSLSHLKTRLGFVSEQMHQYEEDLKKMAGYLEFLRINLLKELDHFDLDRAKEQATYYLDHALFVIEAFVPKTKLKEIESLINGLAVHAEAIAIEKQERIPTHMENEGTNKMGEDLVKIYDVPSPEDKDPSGWVFWAFYLFFAVIISDAGYGCIYLLLALFLRMRFYKTAVQNLKRLINLLTVLSIGCVIWGVLSGAYFGIKLTPDSPLNKISLQHYLTKKKVEYHYAQKDETYKDWIEQFPHLKNATVADEFLRGATMKIDGITSYVIKEEFNDAIFLEIALLLGIIHISLSLFRSLRKYWSGIGWVACVIGGYLYFPSMLATITMVQYLGIMAKEMSFAVGLQLLIGGGSLALLLGVIQHRVRGLEEIAKSIQILADTLSYLRLYALGLAAMVLAATFNQLGQKVGLVGGILIILIGHSVNIVLGTMGGVIHGLRLNFIEWYHYSFEGGGKAFNPLKLRVKSKEK